MADDADFSNGRLRLTAFLCAVENGLPQRPSRFRRKVQSPRTVSVVTSDASALGAPRTARELPGTSHDDAIESMDIGAQNNGTRQASVDHRSPTPLVLEKATPPNVIDHGKKKSMDVFMDTENRPQPGVIISAHQSATKRRSKPSREPLRPHMSPNSQKVSKSRRDLPVNCLALLRTTTSDGLPDPFDARTTFAIPIAEVDPIHDTQQTLAPLTHEHVHVAQLGIDNAASKPPQSDCQPQQPGCTDSYTTPQKAPVNINLGQYQLLTLHDGFVGAELTIIPTTKTTRRAKNTPRVLKPKSAQKGLQLVTGELPAPLLRSDDQETAAMPRNKSVAVLPARHCGLEVHPRPSTLLDSTKSTQIHQERARVEQHQLTLISAPVQSKSDVFHSNMIIEEPSRMTDGEDVHVEGQGKPSQSHFSGPRATIVTQDGYFPEAMRSLESD